MEGGHSRLEVWGHRGGHQRQISAGAKAEERGETAKGGQCEVGEPNVYPYRRKLAIFVTPRQQALKVCTLTEQILHDRYA